MDRSSISSDALAHAIRRHGGNRRAMADSLPCSMNTLRRALREHGLEAAADDAASKAKRPGPRRNASEEQVQAERDALVAAMASSGGDVKAAADALGLKIATMYRRLRTYGVTRAEAAQAVASTPSPDH